MSKYRTRENLLFCGGKLGLQIVLQHNQTTVRPQYLGLSFVYTNIIYFYCFSVLREAYCMFCLIYCYLVLNVVASKRSKVYKENGDL